MQNFKSFGPLGAELQAPSCPRTRTLLPPFIKLIEIKMMTIAMSVFLLYFLLNSSLNSKKISICILNLIKLDMFLFIIIKLLKIFVKGVVSIHKKPLTNCYFQSRN